MVDDNKFLHRRPTPTYGFRNPNPPTATTPNYSLLDVEVTPPITTATPDTDGDATETVELEDTVADQGDAVATPIDHGDVEEGDTQPAPPSSPTSAYDLTAKGSCKVLEQLGKKKVSERSFQRWCKAGTIDCRKIKTTRNGVPVQEWLANSASLLAYAKKMPYAMATPDTDGDASETIEIEDTVAVQGDDMATPNIVGDAEQEKRTTETVEKKGTAMATTDTDGDANIVAQVVAEESDKVELMVENAKLHAELEGRDRELKLKDKALETEREYNTFFRSQLEAAQGNLAEVLKMRY